MPCLARTHPGTENWPWAGEMPDLNPELVNHVRVDFMYPSVGQIPVDYMYLGLVYSRYQWTTVHVPEGKAVNCIPGQVGHM